MNFESVNLHIVYVCIYVHQVYRIYDKAKNAMTSGGAVADCEALHLYSSSKKLVSKGMCHRFLGMCTLKCMIITS